MKRRQFVKNTALGVTGTATLSACSDRSKSSVDEPAQEPSPEFSQPSIVQVDRPKINWKMATSWSKSSPVLFETVDLFCQQVSKMTNGNFVITPYSAGELTAGLDVLQGVRDGTVECGHSASYFYLEQSEALAFGTTMPFGLTADQQNAWLYFGGGLEAMQKLYASLGIINFPGGNTGMQMGGWFNKKVSTPDDFQGLKIRIRGMGSLILEQLGAEIVSLTGSSLISALEAGKIDAAEWKNPHTDQALGLDKVAPYYYYPGWWEPGTSYEFQINLAKWNKLPLEYQEVFKAAAVDVKTKMLAKFNALNAKGLEEIMANGTELIPFSQEILEASSQKAFELYEQIAVKDPNFKQIYRQWQAFRAEIQSWNSINELTFANSVAEILPN